MPTADDVVVNIVRRELQTGWNANRPDTLRIYLRDLLTVYDRLRSSPDEAARLRSDLTDPS